MKKKRKKIVKWVIVVVFAAAVGFAGYTYINNRNTQASENTTTLTKRTATVLSGDVLQSISASGALEASAVTDYKAPSQGELVELTVKDGDYVEKGAFLASMDTAALDDKIDGYLTQIDDTNDKIASANEDIINLNEDISDIYDKIEDKKDEITELETEINVLVDSKRELTIYAPVSGVIFDIKASVGAVVNDGTVLATVTDTSTYEVELAVSSSVFSGDMQSVYVYYKNTRYDAIIVSYADYTYKDQYGKELVDVIFRFTVDSGIPDKDKVHAIVTVDNINYFSYADAIPYYAFSESIKSAVQGEITSLYITAKKAVTKGDVVATLDSSYIDDKIDSISSQIESLNAQIDTYHDQIDTYNDQIDNKLTLISDYEETISDIYQSIKETEEDYSDLQIFADYNGFISNVNAAVGDSVTSNLTLFTLTSMDEPKIVMSIDELDISKIKTGMEASVIIDALESTSLNPVPATVTKIGTTGKSSGGVTTYSVTVSLTESVKGLMLSMNSTATIYIDKSENTLYLPIEAITVMGGKKYVYVETGSTESPAISNVTGDKTASGGFGGRGNFDTSKMTDEQRAAFEERAAQMGDALTNGTSLTSSTATSLQDYYMGTTLVEVTTGVYNESYIEILTGVERGQIVVLPPTYTSASSTTQSTTGNLMGIGGLTGGGTGRIPGANGGFTGGDR